LQIPSMAYPPSSTVSHFKMIFSMSNLNDWLIADGVFFVIRCIIFISNKTGVKSNQVAYLFLIRSVVQWHEACVDLYIIDTSEMKTLQLHRDNHYATYLTFTNIRLGSYVCTH
jgi:hypothetical protein